MITSYIKIMFICLLRLNFANQNILTEHKHASSNQTIFTPQPLRVARVLFYPWCLDGQVGGRVAGKVCPGWVSQTVRCRTLKLGRDIGWGV